jgi:hypothetical protein
MLVLALAMFPACGGTTIETAEAGPDATTGADAANDSGHDATSDSAGDAVVCAYQETRTATDRTCTTSADCVVVVRSVTCCQEQHEGIRSDRAANFQSQQAAVTAGCPGCGCLAQPVDDNGQKGVNFAATCDNGSCTSHAQ